MRTLINSSGLALVAISIVILTSCNNEDVLQPERKDFIEAVFASGHIEQERSYTLSAQSEGIITSLPVKEGQSIHPKDLIAVIESDVQKSQYLDAKAVYEDALRDASSNSPQLKNLQAQIDQAKEQLQFDQENFERYSELYKTKSVSKLDRDKAELQYKNAKNQLTSLEKQYQDLKAILSLQVERSASQFHSQESLLNDYSVFSRHPGTLIYLYKTEGELVRKGEAIAKIGSGDYIIKLYVGEEDIIRLQLDQSVDVSLNTHPIEIFEARVSRIYPGFDELEQSYVVEAKFIESPKNLYYGTQLQANIRTLSRKDVLAIRADYVDQSNYVHLASGEKKYVLLADLNEDWKEIVSGLSEEDLVVKPQD